MGAIGALLPVLIWVMGALRPSYASQGWVPWSSISAYYYSGANALFVGLVMAMSFYLVTYRGYGNSWGKWDRFVGRVAAIAALLLALFPTEVPAKVSPLNWWEPWMCIVHNLGAATLFICFAVFSLVLFQYGSLNPDAPVPVSKAKERKKVRDRRVHLACGITIVVCLIICVVLMRQQRSIFLPESLGLIAFAVSWLVKGDFQPDEAATTVKEVLVGPPKV